MKLKVLEFQMEYSTVNSKLMVEDPKKYERAITAIHFAETDKGYKVKKINKPTKKGLKVTFTPFESQEDVDKYKEKIKSLLNDYKQKWNEAVLD